MLKQQLNYKLSQKLSPQQIQLMKLIQLPTQAFEQRISQEIEENPALESGKEEKDDVEDEFTNEQFETLLELDRYINLLFDEVETVGHRDLFGVAKTCPNFDVRRFFKNGEICYAEMEELYTPY